MEIPGMKGYEVRAIRRNAEKVAAKYALKTSKILRHQASQEVKFIHNVRTAVYREIEEQCRQMEPSSLTDPRRKRIKGSLESRGIRLIHENMLKLQAEADLETEKVRKEMDALLEKGHEKIMKRVKMRMILETLTAAEMKRLGEQLIKVLEKLHERLMRWKTAMEMREN